ncbi:MAG: hypothetical protein K5762_07400 [Bacilli bacterium]|nr:hypothetical protein [Bacilli bacterium]
MAIQLSSHRCDDCSGKLVFNKDKKRFECPYCGKIFEQDLFLNTDKIQIEGLAGIKQTVRSVLSSVAKLRFDLAEKDLAESEKLDHDYVGTYIANLAYYFYRGTFDSGFNRNVANAKITFYKENLLRDYPDMLDQEKDFYDYLDDSSLFALLYPIYLALHLAERASYIAHFIDFDRITNPHINKRLLPILLKAEAYDEIKAMMNNLSFVDGKYALFQILKYYPDNNDKVALVDKLLNVNALDSSDQKLVTKYLQDTNDNSIIQLMVVISAAKTGLDIDIKSHFSKLIRKNNDDDIRIIFNHLKGLRLQVEDSNAIVEYLFSEEGPSKETLIYGLACLKQGKALYEISADQLTQVVLKKNLSLEDSQEILMYLFYNFRITERSVEHALYQSMMKNENSIEQRVLTHLTLLKHLNTLSIETISSYINDCCRDKEKKIVIINAIMAMHINSAYFNSVLTDYVLLGKDDDKIKSEIIIYFLKKGLRMNEKASDFLLCNLPISSTLEGLLFQGQISFSHHSVNHYIENLDNHPYNTVVLQNLLDHSQKISEEVLDIYLFSINENSAVKQGIVRKMLQYCSLTDRLFYASYNGKLLEMNLAQKYLLLSNDEKGDRLAILNLLQEKAKLKNPIYLDRNKILFKKFIVSEKAYLDEVTIELCEELGVFKLFF